MIEKSVSKIKALHNEERITLWENLPLDSPKAIFFEPSTQCNFKCCYCTHSLPKDKFEKEVRKYSVMEYETFYKAAIQLREFNDPIKLVELSGVGEPLFNKELPKMIQLLKEIKACEHIRLITNGVLLDKEKAEAIVSAGVDSVRISLQGMSSQKYKDICKTTVDFEKIIENIKFFYNNRGNTKLFIKNIDIALEEKDYEVFYKRFADISDRMFVENIIQFFTKVDYGKFIGGRNINRYGDEKKKIEVCPNTFTALVINVNGDISMCGKEIAPIYLGNVKTTTLLEAWNSNKRKKFLRLQLQKKRGENEICKNCKIPSESLASEKDILDPYAEILLKNFL